MPRLTISPEVADALGRRPILALETSVIAGGLPYPANLESAQAVDGAARAGGAVPARIAVLDGALHVGLTDKQLQRIAEDPKAVKASVRDIGRVAAGGGVGALTVSGAVHGARLAGIEVLAVAGIGGVHRGAATSFDVSADLPAFVRNRVAVVCAGVKSILDAGLTLEWLETHSVPVVGYRCDEFPGYVSVSSGRPNPHRLDDLGLIARSVLAHWDSGVEGGFLVTHPIAAEHGVPFDVLEARIAEAEVAAREARVTGPDITPFLLKELARNSGGQTSAANREVLLSTTRLGAEFAVRLFEERLAAADGVATETAGAAGAAGPAGPAEAAEVLAGARGAAS
ncbi:pseudouridine-5'-phosphate glycosidase [Catenulispora sp. GAS73]|uniref:pseudouridine-5'-phosphate glycosidase n=1 Tax=Catenulispora sp. GAS73 TaxID=3156269 RepID=UPI003514DF67